MSTDPEPLTPPFGRQRRHSPRAISLRHAHAAHHRSKLNETIAVALTARVGTMAAAYLFAAIGIGSLIGVFTGNVFLALLFGSISSYFLQLVLLPVLAVGG